MSQRSRSFVDDWITEYVHAEGYEPEGSHALARQLAQECLRDAERVGITKHDIEEELGGIVGYMSATIRAVNDAGVRVGLHLAVRPEGANH